MNARKKTSGQNRAIFGSANAAGLDHDELRDLVADVTRRTRSIADLNYAEAEKVIQRLKGEGFVPRRTLQYRRQRAGVQQIITQEQEQLIAELASQRHWPAQTLIDFCKRQCKHYPLRTTQDANKVVEALKAMNRREGLWAA